MDLSTKTQSILTFLQAWSDEEHIYDLIDFHSMEIYGLEKETDFLKRMWDVDLSPYFKDEFYAFSTEGDGTVFAFWVYPELQGEPPIVVLPSHGEEVTLLAANLNDLVCKMIHNIGFNGGWHCEGIDGVPLKEDLENFYDEIASDYEDDISVVETKKLIAKNRQLFKEKAEVIIDFKTKEEVEISIQQSPSFVCRAMHYQLKNDELSFFNRELQSEEEFKKLLDYWTKCIEDEYSENYKKEIVINAIRESYPNYNQSKLFQDWVDV
jgi:hypothetical protein